MSANSINMFKERLRKAIETGGGATSLSSKTGIPYGTVKKYSAKTSIATFPNVAKIALAAGVSIEWIAYGNGQMLINDHSPITINKAVMGKFAKLVSSTYKNCQYEISDEIIAIEASNLYNNTVNSLHNINDIELIDSLLPQAELELKRRLLKAKASAF